MSKQNQVKTKLFSWPITTLDIRLQGYVILVTFCCMRRGGFKQSQKFLYSFTLSLLLLAIVRYDPK